MTRTLATKKQSEAIKKRMREIRTGLSGLSLVVVVALLAIANAAIKSAAALISDSKSEFVENLRWLKATLLMPDTSARNQLRSESFSREGEASDEPVGEENEVTFRTRTVSPLTPK